MHSRCLHHTGRYIRRNSQHLACSDCLHLKCCCKACVWNTYMLLCEEAPWVTCKPIVCLLAFLPHACCLASLQYVTCILPRNATCFLDCVHPSGKLADSGSVLHVLFVATMHAVCLILYRYVCLQVLSWQQSAGRCTSCAKWPCSQVFPCLSSQQVDNPECVTMP